MRQDPKNIKPQDKSSVESENRVSQNDVNSHRRKFLGDAGRMAYTAPVMVTMTFFSGNAFAQNPPPSGGQTQSVEPSLEGEEPVGNECDRWLSPDCID